MGGSLEVDNLGVFYYLSAHENWPIVMDFGGSGLIYMRESTIFKKKTLPTIWGTYMKLVTKYQISAINSS